MTFSTKRTIKGNSYDRITPEEAKQRGYVGSEHMEKLPDETIAYHIQSGTFWSLDED